MQKIRKDLFPMAGQGTRFFPMTKSSPKGIISIIDKPVIQHVLEETVEAGICIGTGSSRQDIEDHFDTSYELEDILRKKNKLDILKKLQQIASLSKTYAIPQKEALGLGHPVLCSELDVRNEPFAVAQGEEVRLFLKGDLAHGALVGSEGKLTEKEEYVS